MTVVAFMVFFSFIFLQGDVSSQMRPSFMMKTSRLSLTLIIGPTITAWGFLVNV